MTPEEYFQNFNTIFQKRFLQAHAGDIYSGEEVYTILHEMLENIKVAVDHARYEIEFKVNSELVSYKSVLFRKYDIDQKLIAICPMDGSLTEEDIASYLNEAVSQGIIRKDILVLPYGAELFQMKIKDF